MEPVDTNALYLGPKSENGEFFQEMLRFAVDDHLKWRRDFHPEDGPAWDDGDRSRPEFAATLQKTREALVELAADLQRKSMPWHSPRYLGHMTSDTLMAASLAAMLTLLYNPNNCAYEASPATTALELEAGSQIAAMLGFDPARAFGHITSGGTIANYEGLWMARNLKSVPRALREACPELVEDLDEWRLSNVPPSRLLDLLDRARESGVLEKVVAADSGDTGGRKMETREDILNRVVVLALKGHLATLAAADLEKRLEALVRGGQDVLIDLAQLEYISSSGLRAFLVARKEAQRSGARMVICGSVPEVRRIFEIAGFDAYFAHAPTRDEALPLFAGSGGRGRRSDSAVEERSGDRMANRFAGIRKQSAERGSIP